MDNILAYANSDSESEKDETETIGQLSGSPDKNVRFSLPAASSSSATAKLSAEGDLEPIVRRRSWEIDEAPKPPGKKPADAIRVQRAKNSNVVKISLPSLPDSDSDEDEDQTSRTMASKRPGNASNASGGSKLLSMLPPPSTAASNGPATGNFQKLIPQSVKSKKSIEPPKKLPEDFFGFTGKDTSTTGDQEDEFSAEIREENNLFQPEIHPSQMYNLANYDAPSTSSEFSDQHRGQPSKKKRLIDNEQARRLIEKYEADPAGVAMPDELEIVDVHVDSHLGDVRENLLKNITTARPADAMLRAAQGSSKTKDDKKPNFQAKRKHQITYLAQLAKASEDQLQNEWAKNRLTKKQTQAKYGF